MNRSRLLLYFSLSCLVLSIFGGVLDIYAHKHSSDSLILGFVGVLGTLTIGALKEYDGRLKALEKERSDSE